MVKNLPARAEDRGSVPGFGKIPWSRKWQPASVFLPGKFHGQEEPGRLQIMGSKVSDTTEHTHTELSKERF